MPARVRDQERGNRNRVSPSRDGDMSRDRRMGRDRGNAVQGNRDRSPVRPDSNRNRVGPQNERSMDRSREGSARSKDRSPVLGVDNWGRELRLGGADRRLTPPRRQSIDTNSRPDRRRSIDRDREDPRDRRRPSRERDWKRSVENFLGGRGSRGSTPSKRAVSRDRPREIPVWSGKTEGDWDRDGSRFDRDRRKTPPPPPVIRHAPSPPRISSRSPRRNSDRSPRRNSDRSPRRNLDRSPRRNSDRSPRRNSDRSPRNNRSPDAGKRGRGPSPKRNKSRDCTPVVDEKYDGEDMVISDDDNNEDGKNSNDEWEDMVLQKFKTDNPANDKSNYRNSVPRKTIVVRCMPSHVTEVDIHMDITACSLVCHDIRLVRRKDTGFSRGFAFVEFYNVEDAVSWMEQKKGVLWLGEAKCFMEYSLPRDQGLAPVPATPKFASDWICTKCSAHNFSKRFLCYVCNTSRSVVESETNEIQSCDYPTNTVVLIGLDVLTTEETVLKSIASLSNLPMISVKIARDPLTNISKGACYIEMNNVLNAHHLHRKLKELTTPIDGRIPEVKYAKLDGNRPPSQAVSILPKSATGSGKIGNAAIAAAQWSHQSGVETYTLADVPRLAEYSAELYANTPEEKVAYIAYYKKYYKQQISEGHTISLPSDSSSGLAAAQAAVAGTKAANSLAEPPDGSGSSKYPVPDTSQYQYDATSGFYYDPYTTLYFDANSQYYYNSKLSKYLYWDGTRQTYLPTPTTAQVPEMSNASGSGSTTNATIVGAPQPAAKTEDKKKEKDGDDRVKIAKRIAKDMEKWAKTLNQKKEAVKQPNTPAPVGVPPSKTHGGNAASSADIGFAVLERKDHLSTLGNYYNNPVPTRNEFTAPVLAPQPPPAPESDEEDEAAQEDKSHTDWDRLICLLCKRQLGSREALVKHQQMSELHKQNLAAWYSARGLDPDDAQMRKIQYRDRASERRQKYGLPDTPKPSRLKETYIKAKQSVYEQPTAKGIGSSNLGNKLLQKMGWQEGMGLGKSNQGRTSIIEAKPRSSTAGLGTRSSGITPAPGESYKDCVKKMMAIRYAQLDDQD
ncbi:RNA-Hypothetical protein protein [Nesidiocoris tenuis]|nr:RNA-Hypothetical protein protein [Nesidiocoris tenuis]